MTWVESRIEKRQKKRKKHTTTFFPSCTLVIEIWSFPLHRRCASSGKNFSKFSKRSLLILNEGEKAPRERLRASVATLRTSLVISPETRKKKVFDRFRNLFKNGVSSFSQSYGFVLFWEVWIMYTKINISYWNVEIFFIIL